MGRADDSPWAPLPLADAVDLFRDAPFRWWVSGGHALDLHLGRSWRSHVDTDISLCRRNVSRFLDVLDGWDIHVAAAGALSPWDGGELSTEQSENNLWCRRTSGRPWQLDITISDGDDSHWIYRRDPSIRLPWKEALLGAGTDVWYLAPELQLLFKSRNPRPKDDLDALTVIPKLSQPRQSRLAKFLPTTHRWRAHLRDGVT